MNKKKIIIIGIIGTVLCASGIMIHELIKLGTPTEGKMIQKYANPKKALLVIDIQEDYTGSTAKSPFPYKNSVRFIGKVNSIIEKAKNKNVIIIYISQEFESVQGRILSKIFPGGTSLKGQQKVPEIEVIK